MRDEEEYYDDEDDVAPRSRVLAMASVLAGVAALIGFIWLAWHAYTSGSATYDPAQAELVKAEASPYKEVPADPGGWQAPHRDKTIYEVIENGKGAKPPKVAERLTDAPEEPMDVPATASAKPSAKAGQDNVTSTWMNAKLREDGSEVPLTDAERQKTLRETQPNANQTQATAAPAESVTASPDEIQPVTQPVLPPKATAKAETKTETPKPVAAAPAKTGSARVQLGAFRSEAEAADHVKHLSKRVPGVLNGKSTTVERADLGEKGIYYRLFALGFSKADATAACDKIKAARLDCMVK